jgi:hypothetical protein
LIDRLSRGAGAPMVDYFNIPEGAHQRALDFQGAGRLDARGDRRKPECDEKSHECERHYSPAPIQRTQIHGSANKGARETPTAWGVVSASSPNR